VEYRAHRRRLSSGKFRRIESAVPAPEAHADAAPGDRPRWSQSQEVEAARKVLTPKRLELLRAIRRDRPASISQLAKLLGRDFKNVHADVQALARYGLVSLTTTRAGRRTSTPRVPFSVLEFRIAD